jgi:hypothetical protein
MKKNNQTMKNETTDSYIIRIYQQDLCIRWIDRGGYQTPSKCISQAELIEDLKKNGLEIVKFTYSTYGGCYFFEVKGKYSGNIEFQKLDIKAIDFFCKSV